MIAYSTMSQIGYMIMGVSVGAYAAGLFHLMTHAFFKALLFMAAGSLIGAMAGEQSLDKMGGFRKAMPFTYGCFIIGGLALSGMPPFSGFFSKDEILLVTGERGGWHWALYGLGYIGALLTAIYTFRMIFRAFHGEPVPEARELEEGHLHHAEAPFNPANGEAGGHSTSASPARPTRSPNGRCRWRWRWACSRVGAIGAGARADPESRLRDRPTSCGRRSRTLSHCTNRTPRTGCSCSGSVLGTRARPGRDRDRLPRLGRSSRGPPSACASALPRAV